MHLIQSLKNEFCFDLPMFSKYPAHGEALGPSGENFESHLTSPWATSINSYFYKMTLIKEKYFRFGQGYLDYISITLIVLINTR